MHTGTVTPDNLSQILRGISQRRQSGVLDITFPDKSFHVIFVGGKIVEALSSEQNQWQDLIHRLITAQVISDTPSDLEPNSYKDILIWLDENSSLVSTPVNEQDFRRLVKHRVLDSLYSFSLEDQAQYNFKMNVSEYDKDFCPLISVGQFLLDSVSLEAESERFARLFPLGSKVIRLDSSGITLTEDESILYNLIGNGTAIEVLSAKSFLSRYALQSSFLAMHERALIEVEVAGQEVNSSSVLSGDIISLLEDHSERPLVEETLRPVVNDDDRDISAIDELEDDQEPEISSIELGINEDHIERPKTATLATPRKANTNRVQSDKGITGLRYLNALLINGSFLPNLLIFVFLIAACYTVLMQWSQIWAAF